MKSTEIEAIINTGEKLPQQFGFIPGHLELSDRPELSVFPFNILFVSHLTDGKQTIAGVAEYLPDLDSYQSKGESQFFAYQNKYNPADLIVIIYGGDSARYEGIKIIEGDEVIHTTGSGWNEFFAKLTATGLSAGEGCRFSRNICSSI